MAVSLFPPRPPAPAEDVGVEEEEPSEERVGVDEGAWALSAERICAGVTVGGGVCSGFWSVSCIESFEPEAEVDARSMAPLRTSNKDLTSPV